MSILFKGSKEPTVGVEVEVQLIDRKTKDLRPGALQLIQEAEGSKLLRVKSEFTQAMIEVNTPVMNTVAQVGQNLQKQFKELQKIANKIGIDLAIAGTHPFQDWRERSIYPTERYQKILEKFQWQARRLTIFGLHVHVGIQSGERAMACIHRLITYIPHLLALSASSPFWGGRDTGMASCRIPVFASMPTAGLPYYFENWKAFERYFEFLSQRGSLNSIRDIYWDIRPHFDLGTVEVRVCDGLATIKETMALAALIQCLVVWIDCQYQDPPSKNTCYMENFWMAPENRWQAARYGLDGQIMVGNGRKRVLLRAAIDKMVEEMMPIAKSLKCEKELGFVRDILKKGNSANRQRHVYAETKSLVAVVESLIKELKR